VSSNEETPSKFLLGAFGVLTAGLTAFGAVSGAIDRIERNHPIVFWAGAVAVLVAVSLAVFAQTLKPGTDFCYWRRNRWLEAAVVLIVLVVGLGVAGRVTGSRWFYLGAFIVGVVAAVLWPLGVHRPSPGRAGRMAGATDLHRAGIAAFLVGMAAVLAAVVLSSRDQPRPNIAASVKSGEGGTAFTATVDANGLSAGRRVEILVEGIFPPRRLPTGALALDNEHRPIFDRIPMYGSVLGPDSEGKVSSEIELPVAQGLDSIQIRAWVGIKRPAPCFTTVAITRKQASPGCVTVRVPGSGVLPQLGATWESSAAGVALAVHVVAHDVPLRVIDATRQSATRANLDPVFLQRPTLLSVRVTGLRKPHSRLHSRVLYSALLAPDGHGSIDVTVQVPVPASFRNVCASAALLPPSAEEAASGSIDRPTTVACAGPDQRNVRDTSTVWARLLVPKSGRSRKP
jgi:hypothetical protein